MSTHSELRTQTIFDIVDRDEAECACVSDHNPNPTQYHKHHIVPLYAGGADLEDNLVWLCPTTHANVHVLLRAWEKYEGKPPWDIRKHYGYYARQLARRGYEER